MAAQSFERGAVITPVLHELAGDFDGVPLDAVHARRVRLVDGGEHVLQRVPELVEKGLHLVEAHDRRRAADGNALVADQHGHGQHALAVGAFVARAEIVHPGSAAFCRGAAVGVEEEAGARRAVGVRDAEEADVRMPDGRFAVGGEDGDAEQPFGQTEKAFQHARKQKIAAQLFVAVVVQVFALTFRPKGVVPGGERGLFETVRTRESQQALVFAPRRVRRSLGEPADQIVDGRDRAGRFAGQAEIREGAVTEQAGLFAAQRERAVDDGGVVALSGRGAGHKGAVKRFARAAVAAVHHERHVNRSVERDFPRAGFRRGRVFAGLARGLGGHGEQRGGEAFDLVRRAQDQGEGARGVENVVAERGGELGQFKLNGVEPRLFLWRESHAGLLDVLNGPRQNPSLGGGQARRFAIGFQQAVVAFIKRLLWPTRSANATMSG